jgi:hypothetical protein
MQAGFESLTEQLALNAERMQYCKPGFRISTISKKIAGPVYLFTANVALAVDFA